MKLSYSACSDLGRKRVKNEDRYRIAPEADLFLVADGMGGHIAGEIASKIAVDTIEDFITTVNDEDTWPFEISEDLPLPGNQLRVAIQLANEKINSLAAKEEHFDGMGTTIVGMILQDGVSYIGHVGDSRAYLMRNGNLTLLTQDHSWVNMQVNLGLMNRAEARRHPWKNIITRALGTKPEVDVDIRIQPVKPDDILLLCTDGLNSHVRDEEIKTILRENRQDLERAVKMLIDLANLKGGDDNITVLVVAVEEETPMDRSGDQDGMDDEITEVIPKQQLQMLLHEENGADAG
ncbi:Stp1/IreP family PP2C-type Ser/Thr phosphatase [bacterium]|nr:Stp1/IreP family PP2C-type Ser/Thr phosphatase [candidate division CSSED10-310 bacterium]